VFANGAVQQLGLQRAMSVTISMTRYYTHFGRPSVACELLAVAWPHRTWHHIVGEHAEALVED